MRFKQFMRRVVSSGEVETFRFGPEHFKEVGLAASTWGGMPLLEAYQLVNRWNLNQTDQKFVYALED